MNENEGPGGWNWLAAYRWFALLLGAVSVFNLVATVFEIGLSPFFVGLIDSYRALFYPVLDWSLALLPKGILFAPTSFQKDLLKLIY